MQFAETDMAGVLHFSNYYRYMEEVEHAFWRSHGLSVVTRDGDAEISWPRVATACEYFTPARFEDQIELVFTVAHVGDRSATYEIEFRRDGERLATGRITAVCCRVAPGRFEPISIPRAIRERLQAAASEAD